jgi:hypothetical protein
MKLRPQISHAVGRSGILLIECLIYLAVFVILLGGATTVFYFCWDHSKALIYTTDDISSVLRAGERWRAGVRAATGKISVETTEAGEVVKIPAGKREILYRFDSGEISRQIASENFSQLLLPKVKKSQMKLDARGDVAAWRWELELTERRKEIHLPLRFTFEAAQMKP